MLSNESWTALVSKVNEWGISLTDGRTAKGKAADMSVSLKQGVELFLEIKLPVTDLLRANATRQRAGQSASEINSLLTMWLRPSTVVRGKLADPHAGAVSPSEGLAYLEAVLQARDLMTALARYPVPENGSGVPHAFEHGKSNEEFRNVIRLQRELDPKGK